MCPLVGSIEASAAAGWLSSTGPPSWLSIAACASSWRFMSIVV